jgi:hypothetical protein
MHRAASRIFLVSAKVCLSAIGSPPTQPGVFVAGGNRVPTLIAVFAILQGAWTALVAISGEPGTNLYGLLDATVSIGFGVAVFRRRLWGVYGLVTIAATSDVGQLVLRDQKPWLIPIVIYVAGAISLSRSEHVAPKRVDLDAKLILISAVLLIFGSEMISFCFSFFRGIIGFNHSDGNAVLLILVGLWQVWIFARAGAGTPWSFETSLCVAATAIPLGLVDAVFNLRGASRAIPMQNYLYYLFSVTLLDAVWLASYAVVGWGIESLITVPTFDGALSALRTGLWPPMQESRGVLVARLEGVLGAITVALVTAYVSISSGEYATLADSLFGLLCVLGIYFSWRSAVVVGAVDYWISQVLSFMSGPHVNPIVHGMTALVLSLLFVNGVRGVFAQRRVLRRVDSLASEPEGKSDLAR